MSNPIALYMRVSELLGPTYVPCDVHTGLTAAGNCPTDGVAAINAFLAQATEALPVKLVIDIGVACYGPVVIPGPLTTPFGTGHVTIEGCGHDTGFFMMPGSNSHVITNQPGAFGANYPNFTPNTTPPSQSCKNVRIANLYMNGNRGTGNASATTTATVTLGNSNITVASASSIAIGQMITGTGIGSNPSGVFVGSISGTTVGMVDKDGNAFNATAGGSGVSVSFYAGNSTGGVSDPTRPLGVGSTNTWLCGINLVSCADINTENLYYYNIASFICHVGNITNFTERGSYFDGTAVQVLHNDGIHIDGPASQIVVSDSQFNALDDNNIALNAPEGYGGNITDVAISNCNFIKSPNALFGYTWLGGANTKWKIQRVTMVGCNIETYHFTDFPVTASPFILGGGVGSVASNPTVDSIDQIIVSDVNVSCGGESRLLAIGDSCGKISFKNINFTPFGNNTLIHIITSSVVVSDMDTDITLYNNNGTFGFGILDCAAATSTIARFASDIQVSQPSGAGYSSNLWLIDPTNLIVIDLEIKRLNPTYLAALINPKAVTTGTVTSGSAALTVGSGTGIAAGQYVIMAGVPVGTTIASGSGTSWTMSQNASANETSVAVSFLDWTGLGTIRGAGVLGSLFPIPDGVMANGVHYISGTFATSSGVVTGKVAVKNTAGTVVPIG